MCSPETVCIYQSLKLSMYPLEYSYACVKAMLSGPLRINWLPRTPILPSSDCAYVTVTYCRVVLLKKSSGYIRRRKSSAILPNSDEIHGLISDTVVCTS